MNFIPLETKEFLAKRSFLFISLNATQFKSKFATQNRNRIQYLKIYSLSSSRCLFPLVFPAYILSRRQSKKHYFATYCFGINSEYMICLFTKTVFIGKQHRFNWQVCSLELSRENVAQLNSRLSGPKILFRIHSRISSLSEGNVPVIFSSLLFKVLRSKQNRDYFKLS